MPQPEAYIASLDVGTTTIRCIIINSLGQAVASSRSSVKLLYPKPRFVEIDPQELWEQILEVIKSAISDANLKAEDVKCLGISTQRATFITWSRSTGKPFHNFITWKDLRAKELCKALNASVILKTLRCGAYIIYLLTRSARFLTGSRLKIASNHVTGRLLWVLRNIPQIQKAITQGDVMFGTLDTWLLHRFTKGSLHVTDISNASATGFFDPFVLEWGSWAKIFLHIPHEILPQPVANDFNFGATAEDIFGVSIPIRCMMADQSSSMFASRCFACDDIKITLGTGAFVNVNTADKIHTSVTGIYPLIAWKLNGKVVCTGEVACNDCGSLIQWLINMGLVKDPSEITQVVTSVQDNDGVYFIPAFSGFGPPINDERAGSGFLGIKPTTTKNHLIRAVVEGIIFRITLAYQTLMKERPRTYQKVIIDGGVSNNDFVCQMLADLIEIRVARLSSTEMSAFGVGFVAGTALGIWNNNENFKAFSKVDKLFTPNSNELYRKKCLSEFNFWLNAVERFRLWYDED